MSIFNIFARKDINEGVRSARAAAYLKGKGYREVHDIGGIGSYRGKIVL